MSELKDFALWVHKKLEQRGGNQVQARCIEIIGDNPNRPDRSQAGSEPSPTRQPASRAEPKPEPEEKRSKFRRRSSK